MWPFKKKVKPLNNTILLRWRHEALGKLRFFGSWSGYWETRIEGVCYRGESVSGFKAVVGDIGTFIQDALIDRAKLAKNPLKYSEELGMCIYGAYRYIREDGSVQQWHW
jgi:hypothetical protein